MEQQKSRADSFFEGEKIEYEAVRDNLSVKVFMEGALAKPWNDGPGAGGAFKPRVYYTYRGGAEVRYENDLLSFGTSFFYSDTLFSDIGKLGTLFENLSEKAESMRSVMMNAAGRGNWPNVPSCDTLVECLFEIKNQAQGEFLQKQKHNGSTIKQDLWEKYFKSHMQIE